MRWKTLPPGRKSEGSRPNPPNSRRLRNLLQHEGRKTLVQQAQSSDLDVKRQATWGMSVDGPHLAKLMIKYNIGCRDKDVLHIKQIDEDYFDEVVD